MAAADWAGADGEVVAKKRRVLGFVTTVKDGDTAVGYYIGFDRKVNAEIPIYVSLLQSVVGHAIDLHCKTTLTGTYRARTESTSRSSSRSDARLDPPSHSHVEPDRARSLHTIDDHEDHARNSSK